MNKLLIGLFALGLNYAAHADLVKVNQYLYAVDPDTSVLRHVTINESGTNWVKAHEVSK